MAIVSDDRIFQAIKELPKEKKKEVLNFIEFLLNKTVQHKKNPKKKDVDAILAISIWNENDIMFVRDAQKEISKWKIQES
ncbi:MAG: DUF2281 domain-containing protein [bacterium]|jgi:hypothetical protein|nr:DUF2281 domain-containing protein [bacterium]